MPAGQPQPWRISAPGHAPAGQGNVRPRPEPPAPGAPPVAVSPGASRSLLSYRQRPPFGRRAVFASRRVSREGICFSHPRRCTTRAGKLLARLKAAATKPPHESRFTDHDSRPFGHQSRIGIRRLCALGAVSVPSVVIRCLPLRPLRLCGELLKLLKPSQQELPGPTKLERPLQNLRHESQITNHESRIPSHQPLASSHSSNPHTPGYRHHRNSLKTHARALFYSLHSPGVVQTAFVPKGSAI